MACYVVTRHLPGITPDALTSAGLRAKSCAAEMTDEGTPVKWLRSFFIPTKLYQPLFVLFFCVLHPGLPQYQKDQCIFGK